MCYAPSEAVEDDVKNTFFYQLEFILDNVSSTDTIILMGDMNVKVGSHIEGDGSVVGSNGLGS